MKKTFIVVCILFFIQTGYGQQNDSASIKMLLEKESATWRSGDVQAHADCWKIEPYSVMLVSTADGAFYNVPPEMMLHPAAGMMGKGGHALNSNYKFSIHGNDAWVSHDEESISADGTKTHSYEVRLLEKINGEWKLVGQSIHLYKK